MKVFVYYNLRKKCWSVRHKGKVIKHVDKIALVSVKFKVSKAGRERVLREKRKNVHAGVEGIEWPLDLVKDGPTPLHAVTYNPYLSDSFVLKGLELCNVSAAQAVKMDVNAPNKVMALNPR